MYSPYRSSQDVTFNAATMDFLDFQVMKYKIFEVILLQVVIIHRAYSAGLKKNSRVCDRYTYCSVIIIILQGLETIFIYALIQKRNHNKYEYESNYKSLQMEFVVALCNLKKLKIELMFFHQ